MIIEKPITAFFVDSIATVCINTSFSVQKLGHRDVEAKGIHGEYGYLWSGRWWLGLIMLGIGNVVHILVLPHCDISLIAANCALAVVVNVFLSILLLGETFRPKFDLSAILLMLVGSTAIVLSANKSKETYYEDDELFVDLKDS